MLRKCGMISQKQLPKEVSMDKENKKPEEQKRPKGNIWVALIVSAVLVLLIGSGCAVADEINGHFSRCSSPQ